MGSTFLFYEEFLCDTLYRRPRSPPPPPPQPQPDQPGPITSFWNPSNETSIWNETPTTNGIILYSLVTTIICTFGIFGNSLSLIVMRKKKLVGSVYTYLSGVFVTSSSCSEDKNHAKIHRFPQSIFLGGYDIAIWKEFISNNRPSHSQSTFPKKQDVLSRIALIAIILYNFLKFNEFLYAFGKKLIEETLVAVLAATNLLLSIIFFFGGLSRGAFYYTPWSTYDALIGLPLSGAINSLNVMATVAVTVDRVMYLWNPMQLSRPKFCNPKIARELMTASFIISVVLNLPYCFIFAWNDFGDLVTSPFFESRIYALFNWLMLIFFAIIPGVFLILGNGFLIMTLHKSQKITAKCNGRRRNHRNVTMVLIAIIIFFLISEIPSNIVSRTRASSILYFGKPDMPDSMTLVIVRQICTVLGALNVTVSFLVYFLVCPIFYRAMTETLTKKNKIRDVQVNVFVLREKKIPSMMTKMYDMRTGDEPPICIKTNTPKALDLPEESEYVEIIDANAENIRKCINSYD